MAIAGRVAIVPKDDYDASLIYKRLDAVMHNNTLYIAKKDVPAGKVPGADTKDYWMSGPSAGTSKPATTTSNGLMSATDKKAIEVLKKPLATCATGRATAAKVATLANFVLQVGTSIAVKFTDTVGTANPTTGNLTLNVNGTGAKTIGYVRNGNKVAISYVSGNFFYNNATHIFTYDGTFWLCMDWNADNNTTYSNFVKSGAGAKAGLVPAPSTTAGTSKYLREDGTWQTPPDTKTSVVNNQTTTVAGYALDARQANPNIDGTLAKQVADLNGSLKGVINTKNFEVTDKTILEYILSTHSFIGSQTFTATCADKPPNNAEYNIFWFGSNMRITVLALEYAFNTSKLYGREIFGNEWLTGWIEL
jgi:hypothetical protein